MIKGKLDGLCKWNFKSCGIPDKLTSPPNLPTLKSETSDDNLVQLICLPSLQKINICDGNVIVIRHNVYLSAETCDTLGKLIEKDMRNFGINTQVVVLNTTMEEEE